MRPKLSVLRVNRAGLRKTTATVSETHQKAFEILNKELTENLPNSDIKVPMLEAILEALGELEVVSDTILGLLRSHQDLSAKLETLTGEILDELALQESRVHIRATYRDFVSRLRDVLCEDMETELSSESLQGLGWEFVTWTALKDRMYVEKRKRQKDASCKAVVTEAFDSVLAKRGLERNDFDTLMKFKKEACEAFHQGEITLASAHNQLNETFPPDLLPYKPYLRKGLCALETST